MNQSDPVFDLLTAANPEPRAAHEGGDLLTFEDVLSRAEGREQPSPLPVRRRRVPSWVYAIAAAIVVLLAVGVVAWLIQPGTGIAPADTPETSVPPAPETSAPPDTSVPPTPATTVAPNLLPAGAWSRVRTTEGGLGEGVIRSVAAGGPGLVAVGSNGLWTSVDGITWTQVPHDEEVFGDEGPMSVVAAGPGLVAVGEGEWTSVDGFVWSRVSDEEGIFDDAAITSVTVGGPGLVAVGEDVGGVTAWTSVDGIVWSRIPHDEAIFGGSPNLDLTMNHVTEGGPGLVAVGMDWSGPDADAAVWTSVDGVTWTRVPHDEEVFGGSGHQAINGITAAGPGLVAVGTERSPGPQAAVWTSVDGLTWTRVPRDESGSLDGGQMNSVVVTDTGLVAVGWVGSIGGPNSDPAVWTSVDGIVWSRVPHDEEALGSGLMWDLVNTDRGLVAVGSDGTNAAVWVGPEYVKGQR